MNLLGWFVVWTSRRGSRWRLLFVCHETVLVEVLAEAPGRWGVRRGRRVVREVIEALHTPPAEEEPPA